MKSQQESLMMGKIECKVKSIATRNVNCDQTIFCGESEELAEAIGFRIYKFHS